MLRRHSLMLAPKGNGGFWSTMQNKGVKEAGAYAKKYAKTFSQSKQGQDLYKRAAQATATVEMKARGTFNHYWGMFHEVKSKVNTGAANNSNDNGSHNSSNGDNANTNGSSSSSNTTGDSRSFSQKVKDFWTNNQQFIVSFIAANFMGVIFAIQFGGQIWTLVMALWSAFRQNQQIKARRVEDANRKESARRLAQEEQEDALDDVYGGHGTENAHTMDLSDPHNQPNAVAGKLTRHASATNAAVDEAEMQRRLGRREERRRVKEREENGLVMHDDSYSQREERRQRDGNGLSMGSKRLEKEEEASKPMSGMELIASRLLQAEEAEKIEEDMQHDTNRDEKQQAAAQQAYFRKKAEEDAKRKKFTKKLRRKIRKAQREKELQAFFALREAEQAQGGFRASVSSSSASSPSSGDGAAAERHSLDKTANDLAFSESFSYSVSGQEAVSFAAHHDSTHARFKENNFFPSWLKKKQDAERNVFDFTGHGSPDASNTRESVHTFSSGAF